MITLIAFFVSCIIKVFANIENDFVFDYFNDKMVPSVVGFSCNVMKDDASLVRNFNEIGITASLSNLNEKYKIHRFALTNYWKLGVFFDIRCYDRESIISVFSEARDYRMYDELHYWLVLGSSIESVTSIIDDEAFGLSTDFVIAVRSTVTLDDSYELYDVYNIWKERGTTLNITFLGTWDTDNHLSITLNETKFKRRANLHGLILRASFFDSKYKPPNMKLEDYLQDHASPKDGLSKFGFILISHLSEMLNFKLKCGVVAKWEVGDAIGPIIRALSNKEIDITGSPASMSSKRTYLVKYIYQAWPFRSCFIFRNPQPETIKFNQILDPLVIEVWYLTAILFILSVWIMASLLRYEDFDNIRERYSISFLINFGAICQQSTDVKMIHVSTRIAFLFIMIFSLLLYNYYCASVVSARLNEPIYKINDSLSQLSKTNLKFASEWMVYFELFIKRQDWETKTFYTTQWINIPEADRFMEPEKAINLVQKGGFAYHMHPDVGYPLINKFYNNREICELTEVHLAFPTYSTFAISLNSTITEVMKTGFMKISEVGLRKRQIIRWTTQKPHCMKNILSASSINMSEFAPHLLILLFGMILAVILGITEKIEAGQNSLKRKIVDIFESNLNRKNRLQLTI